MWIYDGFVVGFSLFRYKKANITTPDDREGIVELEKNVMKRKAQLYEIEQSLPQKNSLYLKVSIYDLYE